MKRYTALVCSVILLVGVPLIWRAWPPLPAPGHLLPASALDGLVIENVWQADGTASEMFGMISGKPTLDKPSWCEAQHKYFCPSPQEVSGGWDTVTGEPLSRLICFMPDAFSVSGQPKPESAK